MYAPSCLGLPSRTLSTLYSQQPGDCVSRNCKKIAKDIKIDWEETLSPKNSTLYNLCPTI